MQNFTKNILFLVALLVTGHLYAQQTALQGTAVPAVPGNAARTPVLPQGTSQDWFTEAVKNIRLQEYSFTQTSHKMVSVANSANRIGFLVKQDALTVKNIAYNIKDREWSTTFTMQGIGRQGHPSLPSSSLGKVINGKELLYQFAAYDVPYLNDETGLRQEFHR